MYLCILNILHLSKITAKTQQNSKKYSIKQIYKFSKNIEKQNAIKRPTIKLTIIAIEFETPRTLNEKSHQKKYQTKYTPCCTIKSIKKTQSKL